MAAGLQASLITHWTGSSTWLRLTRSGCLPLGTLHRNTLPGSGYHIHQNLRRVPVSGHRHRPVLTSCHRLADTIPSTNRPCSTGAEIAMTMRSPRTSSTYSNASASDAAVTKPASKQGRTSSTTLKCSITRNANMSGTGCCRP